MKLLWIIAILGLAASSQAAPAAQTIPDRCAYAYAAASYRVAFMIHKQITRFGDADALERAYHAVQLSRDLNCPVEPMLNAIDCTVSLLIDGGGSEVTEPEAVECVSRQLGREFPKLGD
ncbi:hypothetical protein [Hoeflea poritis]|uniref:Rap1a immunity protein domain-containing protein n=1 Tax=Hoeflea poritis TaxID=2993659 RepID=A0ABT4VKL7_9HYPH|nr:hypothetical protein [Hoeflea poritis]MDA4845139.1 hypothetical protein [Hoeflea poritis]